ncbi:Holliday junction resolvase RuvX [Amnibacterium sp. CER49]|uniref:Holliday junction resolvase RuvX n=1 Tax=Amnibacterium sp. CER49 TaxID=3039161 RepID=UPI002449E911|nr:Holliday junction resolvase RuvX [Amnibacterium sp. CER49]MDH2444322.1 Holliday junction resolvase RuvX [Amnibacterium sp. CER49]
MRLAVDVGTVRVGIARSDRDGMLAVPVETLQRRKDVGEVVTRITALAEEVGAVEIVVGLPLSMRGTDTASTADARAVASLLAAGPLPVRLVDERLTTVSAAGALTAAGRSSRSSRAVIDQVAAVILLQHALDAERSRGEAPGALVEPKRS